MRLVDLTNEQLAQVGRLLLRRWIDSQTGRRPREQLTALLADEAEVIDLPDLPQQPVREQDIGPVVALRLDHDHAYATTVLRTAGGYTTLAVEFTESRGQPRITRIGPHAPGRTRGISDPSAPEHLAALIGDLPDSAEDRRRWLSGAAVVEAYRDRHRVRDHTSTLGPLPDQPWPRQERQRAAAHLAEIRRQLRVRTAKRQVGRGRDEPGRGLVR